MRLTVLVLILCIFSCQDQGKKALDKHSNKYSLSLYSRPFVHFLREAQATIKVNEYLHTNEYNIDSLYIYNISYSDSLCRISSDSLFIPDPDGACFAIFNITHRVNHDYFQEIEEENERRIKEAKNEDEWIPIVIPSKPEFLKKEILLHYYYKQDSVVSEYVW